MLAVVAACILLTWVLCGIILIGIGSLTLRAFGLSTDVENTLWVGLIACSTFLEIWNLLKPITAITDFLLIGMAVCGLYGSRDWLAERGREIASHWKLLCVYVVIAVGIAHRAAGPCEYYDTGLYGAQLVRWSRTYATVFGLANLHGRLGFNSSVFLIDAALGQGPWKNLYFHLFSGFIFCVFWALVLPSCWRAIRGVDVAGSDWFRVILVIPLIMWSARGYVVGTTTDEQSTVLCLAGAAVLFEELGREREIRDDHSRRWLRVTVAATLLALAVTFKLSVVVFAFLGWVLAFAILYQTRDRLRSTWLAIGGAVVVLGPWVIVHVILTGYPFFPSSSFAFPVDWRVPRAVAEMYEGWVRSWGRTGLVTAEGFGWLTPWINGAVRNRSGFQVPIAIAIVGAAVLLAVRTPPRWTSCRRIWLLLPSLAGILFWFWKSPDPRFGEAAIWALAATLGSLAIERFTATSALARVRTVVGGLTLIVIWCLFSFGWQHSYQILESVHGFVRLPDADVATRRTLSGLNVNVPMTGNQCWDASLPCTAYFDKMLQLRSAPDMRWGFTSQGLLELPAVAVQKGRGATSNATKPQD